MSHAITALKLGATTIDGIIDSWVDPGIEALIAGADSQKYNTQIVAGKIRPVARFECLKVGACMTTFGIDGYPVSATPLDFFTVEHTPFGSYSTTGEKVSCFKGVLVPERTGGTDGAFASITYALYMGGQATDIAPFSITSGQTVPSDAQLDETWMIGQATHNSVDIGPVTRWDIGFGFVVEQDGGDGWVYPSQVCWTAQQPTITVETLKTTAFATITVAGSDDLWTLKLLKCAAQGGRAGSGDKTFSTHLNYADVNRYGATHRGKIATGIRILGIWDGTNNPITVA